MRTVRDAQGNRYLLVKRSGSSSRVRDPETGSEQFLDNAELTVVEGESPLETAARGVPEATRRVLSAVHDDRSLGLLCELVDQPRSARHLLDAYDLCESDLFGLLGEFRAAGLVAETDVRGERGYEATETASSGVAHLRGD
jgi:hypothetical protein